MNVPGPSRIVHQHAKSGYDKVSPALISIVSSSALITRMSSATATSNPRPRPRREMSSPKPAIFRRSTATFGPAQGDRPPIAGPEYPKGEVFGLLGPNGSGKTTTIKLLLGLLFPTSGKALVFNKDATDVAKNERIGYLPEESYLYKFLNAEETLDFYGRLFNMPAQVRRDRIKQLIEDVDLVKHRRRPLREYSKGMTRRIGLAQALINDPELIVLDEPTSGLDPLGTRWMKDLIIRLKERGKTILMSSHLLATFRMSATGSPSCTRASSRSWAASRTCSRCATKPRFAPRPSAPSRSRSARGPRAASCPGPSSGSSGEHARGIVLEHCQDSEARPGRRSIRDDSGEHPSSQKPQYLRYF